MTHTEDLMTNPPAMAEMAGGLPDADTATAHAVLEELENEGHGVAPDGHAAPPVLAHLAAETEE